MAFVNETISVEDKATFDFTVFRGMFGGFKKFAEWELGRWAVDRARNARFLYVDSGGGGYDGTAQVNRYALWWNGHVAYFSSESESIYEHTTPLAVNFRNSKIVIPQALHSRAEDVITLLQDAVHTAGLIFRLDVHLPVNIIGDIEVILTNEI